MLRTSVPNDSALAKAAAALRPSTCSPPPLSPHSRSKKLSLSPPLRTILGTCICAHRNIYKYLATNLAVKLHACCELIQHLTFLPNCWIFQQIFRFALLLLRFLFAIHTKHEMTVWHAEHNLSSFTLPLRPEMPTLQIYMHRCGFKS